MNQNARLPVCAPTSLLLVFCALCLSSTLLQAATVNIYTNDFEAYSTSATDLADTSDADPSGSEWNVVDDAALSPTTAGAGVQVINWLTNTSGGANKALLLRPGTEAQIHLANAKSGTRYQLDFKALIARGPTSDRSFYVILRGEGADHNGQDFIAYRTDRLTNSTALNLFDGVNSPPAWFLIGASTVNNQWQHHRLVINPNAQTVTVYVDDMVTPVTTAGRVARNEISVPTMMRIVNEANSADDNYWVIDEVTLTVDDSPSLATTITEGFESYLARVNLTDDADPQGPWITVETDGVLDGGGRPAAPGKVQVVDSSVVAPHSGSKCLKFEGGQRAGSSLAWGVPPLSDVQVTWWARVPASVQGTLGNYLRMSLYGVEGGNSFAGDSALLGYGSRDATIGDATSITYFTTAWVDTGVDYTPDTWEEYRLITHNSQGKYTILKSPSSASPQIIVDRAPMIGSAGSWGPTFMVAWSSSNGTNHPPVYVDDIEIKSLVSNPDPLPEPYNISLLGRFTNVTVLQVPGPVGKAAFDPRDNTSIIFALDGQPGGLYRAAKIAAGNWAVDPQPIVTGLDRPSGLAVGPDGTIWWTHDFTMSLRRLKAPWQSNSVEEIISDFGSTLTDDDPIDVTIAPTTFTGSLGQPNMVVIADRGTDGDANNAVYLVNPATTDLNQTNYSNFLFSPTATELGGGNLNAITPLPQYGEVVTLSTDGYLAAINGDGTKRLIIPNILWTNFFSGGPAPNGTAIAADPTTGRLWVADDLIDEIWSVDSNPLSQTADELELAFPLTNPSRPDLQIDFHDPGMAFSTNGAYLLVTDTSTANGGGRLLIFHNEVMSIPSFSITSAQRVGSTFQLTWQSAGAVKYRVQRGTNLTSLVDISADLTGTTFSDTNTAAAASFYRVVAKP